MTDHEIDIVLALCKIAPTEAADAIERGDHNDCDIEAVIEWVRHFPRAAEAIEHLKTREGRSIS